MPKFNHIIEKYYFEFDYPNCLESCPIKKDISIGSARCRECSHCIEQGTDWIKCQYLEE